MRPIGRSMMLLVALTMLFATACGGSDASTTVVTADSGGPVVTTTTSGPAEDSVMTEDENFLDVLGFGDVDVAQQRERQQRALAEEAIRVCMAQQGFEYIPVEPPEDEYSYGGTGGDMERRQTYGFGATTWFGSDLNDDIEWVNPNEERLDEMSETERTAFSLALHGDRFSMDDRGSEGIPTTEDGTDSPVPGCQNLAYDEVYGDSETVEGLWEDLAPAFEELTDRIEADPRIVQANADWSACMAAAGYEYASRAAMFDVVLDSLQQRLDDITQDSMTDPLAGMSEDEVDAFFDERTREEIQAFFDEHARNQMETIDQEALHALQQEEITLAVTDGECGVDLDAAYDEVSGPFRAEMIDNNRTVLDQLLNLQSDS